MWKTVDVRILLLIVLLLTNVKTTVLSDQKKCGDPECETSILRVQTIKDYTGPDCRYLNFKSGEEIMVYFKLSRKREDLWGGSKGKDFGYFPMDAVRTEEVFVTEEVEVPTKETDFLCLDGGEYVFENKDSIFNTENEENEYIPFYTDEDYLKSNMPRDEALEVTGTSFPKEYKESDSDDIRSKDQHALETTRYGDSELRDSKTGEDESIQQDDQNSQSLKPGPKQDMWSVSSIAGWLGLGDKQEEEPIREISKTEEQITFRRRKIAITDDSDFKKLNYESETESRTWFQSALTDLMHFGSEKAGFSLLYNENVQDISRITGDADHHDSTTASDTQEEEPRDSEVSKSNWFDLDISDVLTFGYSNENEVRREKYEQTEATNPKEESPPSSVYSTGILMDQILRKQTSESPYHETQEKDVQEITEVKKTDSKVQLANDRTDFKEAMDTSFSSEPGDKLLKSHYAKHSSVSDSEVMENLDIRAIMKESGRKNDQSGWYESIYSSIFGFSRIKSDIQPAPDSVAIQRLQELVIDQFLPSHGADQAFIPKVSPTAREENSGSPQTHQSFFSSIPFTNTLNAMSFASKEKGDVHITEQALKSREGSSQSKIENKAFHMKKESKAPLVVNEKVTEKVSIILDVATSHENILWSSLATNNHEESGEKKQDDELVKDNASPFQSVKFRLERGICYGHHIQISSYRKSENLDMQDNSSIEDYSPTLEEKQCPSLELENVANSLAQQTYTGIYSLEKFVPAIEESDCEIAIKSKDKTKTEYHSYLAATGIYLERLSKGEMTETTQDKEGSNQATNRKLTFKKLKEHTNHFPQMKDNPHEDELLNDIADDDKLDIQQSREQMSSANVEVIENTEVKEIVRHSDGMSQKKCNEFFPNDNTDVNKNPFHNQNEKGAVVSQGIQSAAQFPSSIACESRDLTVASHSEKKTTTFDESQNFLSFNDCEHLLSFQSSTEKDKGYLQRSQDNISFSDESNQSKSIPKLRKKEMEKKKQFHLKKYNLAMKKEGISNEDILLSLLAKQNKDSEGTNSLKDQPLVSSAEHPSGHIIESLFSNQKLKGKSSENSVEQFPNNKPHSLEKQHEAPTLMISVQKLSQDYKVTNEEPTSGIKDVNEKEEIKKKNFVSKALERGYIDVSKREQVSDSVPFLKSGSEKLDNIQGGYMVDSCDENESPDLKSKGKLCLDHAKDYFPTNSDENDNLIKSVVPNESVNQVSQERIKEQGQPSQCNSEHSESKQGDSTQNIEDKLKKQTNKNYPNIFKKQEISPVATSKNVFKSEKDIPGNGGCMSKDDVINNRVQNTSIHFPHKCTAGKHGEEELSSKPIQGYFDHAKVSDASLTAKAVDDHGLKEKLILSYPSSGTFSSKMPVSLPYLKDDQKDLKAEQEVPYSHPELSDCENSYILSQKCPCQMVHNTRKHFPQTPDLDVPELGVSIGHKQLNILNMQSQTFHTGHNDDPRLQSEDHCINHVPVLTKHSLEMGHLTIDLNDENCAQDRFIFLPKTLNYIEQFAASGGSQEKSKKITGIEKEIVLKNIEGNNDKTGKERVLDNSFTKTSWFLGRLLQNKHNKDSTINEKSTDNIVIKGREVEILGSDSEQDKGEVQNIKAISYNFKIMEQRTQEEIYKHTQEKYITSDARDYSQKDNTYLIPETASVVQETAKIYKLITDKELKLEKVSSLSGVQEHYINLAQEFKRILQATMCESYKLLLLEQEFENLCHDITTFPCEEVLSERKQVIASVEYENTFMAEHKKCLNKKMNLVAELQSLMLDVRNKCEAQQADSGTTNTGKLSGGAPIINSDNKPNSGQYLKTNKIPSVNIEHKMCTSESSGHLNLKERVLMGNPMNLNSTFRYAEREWLFQISLYLNDICDLIKSAFSFMMFMREKVVAALPENVRPGPNLYGFPWEMVICCAVAALLIAFLLMYRSYQSVRSRLYIGREKLLASKVAELVEDKCKVLEKLSLCKKEYEELENSVKDAGLLSESTNASNFKTACEQLSSLNSVLKKEIDCLEKELEEEKSKRSQQDDLMAEIQRRMESLESEAKSIYQQIAEAKTTLKVYDINRERLKMSVQDAVEENSRLQESEKQLLQEAKGWDERFNELNEQTKMFESSKANMEESLKNKESQVKSLTECLLKMKDWSSAIGEHDTEDNYWDNDMKEETENGEHLGDQDKRTVRKLIYAAKLNASLKSLETERNQIYSKLTDENKAKEELAERIENLQREHVTLQSEKRNFESEVQKLQQKLKVMTELYQENEMNLHRKLTVEEKERLQKEEKLSKADEKINHAAEELATYRQRAKDLEDELERTVRSFQNQIMSHEKKAHDNWLTARATERFLNDIKKENLHCRQELTEAEIKCDLLEKDPYAFHVPIRAFGRGSRGPGNSGIYEAGNEREELSSDRLSNPHRPPSDSGSLSPPWDRDRRIMPIPPGQPYNDQSLPPQRQERFYPNPPNSGRLSGPAELRSYNMHSFDKADGHISENNSRMDLSGNGMKDNPNDSNMPNVADRPVALEGETFGPGVVPPPSFPLLRAPLMPMDPRGPFIRRGPPFPPVPPSGGYGPREYFPRDFASLPRPPLPMRTPFPLRPFSQYPPPRAGFFSPPPPPPPDNSNELPAGLTQLSVAASTDHQEPQQET
ncbi:melanoma inhibitory activity protein 2 isoform X3 [Heteronotia binoei]|uniref:melanoma inhibitory activity protein 2 isoform X3 n=1 Tax=Heteronotia binoei TaxID=13085 RepID=UPI00292FCF7B|nr:melanoma inhibitory activity protein 2 isoform X3 [Heteronotia binoei]